MKSQRTSSVVAAAVLAAITGTSAAADSGWYLGANVGRSRADVSNAQIRNGLLGAGFTMSSYEEENNDLGYKLFGGYDFSRYFALEGGYFDLGKFGYAATTVPPGTLSGNLELQGVNLDAVVTLPFTERFGAFGRVGANYAEAKDSYTGTGSVNMLSPNGKERATNVKFGFGLQFLFTPSFGMRAEAERYRISEPAGTKGDIDLFSLGLVYRFGRATPAPVAAALPPPAMPQPVAARPPPPPAPVAPVAPRTQRYCSILNLQFEINKDDIQRQYQEKLGVVGTFLKKYPNSTAVIEGHTDDVGSDETNLRLSQRRAESVVSYLIDSLRVTPAQLTAIGYGESRPLADNRTEEGKRLNRRIEAVIECATDVEGLAVKSARMTMALQIEFDQNKADVRPQYQDDLREVADFLKANPDVTATVEGHTGNLQATPELALQISQQRAQNVVNYLVDNFGIARSRLSAAGFGRSRPFAYNTSLAGQQDNRRVNVIINYPK